MGTGYEHLLYGRGSSRFPHINLVRWESRLAPSLTHACAPSSRHPTGNPEALPLPNRRINSRTHVCHLSHAYCSTTSRLRERPTTLKDLAAFAGQQSNPARNLRIDLEPTDSIRQTAPNGRNAHVHPQAPRVG